MARNQNPQAGSIKFPIQRGVIAMNAVTSATATITSVDVNKCELRMLGAYNTSVASDLASVVLTNATTVTANRGTTTGTSNISWELTEYY